MLVFGYERIVTAVVGLAERRGCLLQILQVSQRLRQTLIYVL